MTKAKPVLAAGVIGLALLFTVLFVFDVDMESSEPAAVVEPEVVVEPAAIVEPEVVVEPSAIVETGVEIEPAAVVEDEDEDWGDDW